MTSDAAEVVPAVIVLDAVIYLVTCAAEVAAAVILEAAAIFCFLVAAALDPAVTDALAVIPLIWL